MDRYLRPETLFGTKFESYLNEKPEERSIHNFSKERPSHWKEPEPVSEAELSEMKKLEDELPF